MFFFLLGVEKDCVMLLFTINQLKVDRKIFFALMLTLSLPKTVMPGLLFIA